jgi:hypothetical protein
VDWIQFPFEVDAKIHNGPDAPVVRLRWMRTTQKFLPVGTQCVIMNRIWDEDQSSDLSVGQLPLVKSHYVQDARWVLPAALRPGHICHPEWLATGEPWPNDLPPTEYGPSGIPTCCGLSNDGAAGGVEIGGTVGDHYTPSDATAGGVEIGGRVGDVLAYTDPAGGGEEIGGACTPGVDYLDRTRGGMEMGCAVGDLYRLLDGSGGGLEIGGLVGDHWTGSGPTVGGLEIGGPCGDVALYVDATEGGLEIGGPCGDVALYVDATEGGLEIGGAAGDNGPLLVTPGLSCSTAPLRSVGQQYIVIGGPGITAHWHRYNLPNGVYSFFLSDDPSTSHSIFQLFTGPSCSSLGASTEPTLGTTTPISVSNGVLFFKVSHDGPSTSALYLWRLF